MKRADRHLWTNSGLFIAITIVNAAHPWMPPEVPALLYFAIVPALIVFAARTVVRRTDSEWGEQSRALLVQAAMLAGGFPSDRFFANARTLAVLVIVDVAFCVMRQEFRRPGHPQPEATPPAVER